jgi:hypothetical protein
MTTPKPGPRINALHAQILTSLLDNKPHQLSNNISEFNVNVLAKRWMP